MEKMEDDQRVFDEKDEKEANLEKLEKLEKLELISEENEKDLQTNPPQESAWRLVKYFDEMNNIEQCPVNPDLEDLETGMSNCTDTDMDESASVLYAYNYLKEYVQHMKSAMKAKDGLMSVLPMQGIRSPPLMQDSDSSLNNSQPPKQNLINSNIQMQGRVDNYDHIQPKDDTYYASMKLRSDCTPTREIKRTMSDSTERNGYAIPYVTTRSNTMPQHSRIPIHGTVSCAYPRPGDHHDQAEVVEICPPSDTSMCSTAYWRPEARKEEAMYESIEKFQLRQDSDDYFIPRAHDRQSNSDSSSCNQPKLCESISQNRRKCKRPIKNSKVYMTTNRVFHQPIIHSKECLDSLNSDEVRPCNCLKTVTANLNNKTQQSPSKHVHVMEPIPDGEVTNYHSVFKKKVNRTRAVAYPDSNISSNNSSEQNFYVDDFENYDRANHHAYAVRSRSYQPSFAPTMGINAQYPNNSFSHHPDRENGLEKGEPMSRSLMYMPSERWNFAFQPYESSSSGSRSRVIRHHSVDAVPGNISVERTMNELKSASSLSKTSSKDSSMKSERSSSRSSRGSSSTDTKETSSPKKFFKHFTNIFVKNVPPASIPVRPQVSEL